MTDGSFDDAATSRSCKFTNTRTTNAVSLQKNWVDGVKGDTAKLTITGGTGATKTSTSNGDTGSWTDTGKQATSTVGKGTTVTVGEQLGASNLGVYGTPTLACTADGQPFAVTGDSFEMPNKVVVCTYTNDRIKQRVELVKKWVNSKAGDKAALEIDGGVTAPATGTAFAPAEAKIQTDAFFGETVTVSEDVTGSGYYDQELVCEADGKELKVANDGSFTMPNEPVTCTFTNTRTTLKLVKQVDGKGDPNDWKLTATADGAPTVENLGGQGVPTNVRPDVQYTLKEEGPAGYTPGTWVCQPADNGTGKVTAADLQDALNNGDNDKVTLEKGANIVCTIINTRDLGSLQIVKKFDPKTSGYDKAFSIDYKCQDEAQGTVSLKAGESKTIDGIPTGTECTVSEVKPTDPPEGWSFSEPKYDPADGKVTVAEKGQTVTVTVTNEILNPGIKIVKTASPTQVNPGEIVTYTYTVTNTGDTDLSDVVVKDDKCSPVEYKSGDANNDSKLQTSETWTYTCSQPITVATTNVATVTGKDKNGKEVTGTDTVTVPVTNPIVVKKICPIDVTLHKPTPKKVGNKILTDKIKTKKSSCVLLKPVVLCRPLASTSAGEKAFCVTKVTKTGRVTVKTKGYDAVRVTVIVRSKPKPGFEDRWKPNSWRKSWILR